MGRREKEKKQGASERIIDERKGKKQRGDV